MTQETFEPTPEGETGFRPTYEGPPRETGSLFIFIGPQTGGKSSVIKYINEEFDARKITTVTTREPRPDDDPGSYTYMSKEQFETAQSSGNIVFVDHYGNGSAYGNPLTEVETLLTGENRTLILDVPHIYNLADELREIFGNRAQEIIARTHIFYIGVPAVRDIPVRFQQRQSGIRDIDRQQSRKRFQGRLRSDIHSWRELRQKEAVGQIRLIRHTDEEFQAGEISELPEHLDTPEIPTIHLIINESGHLEDRTVPAVAGIIRSVLENTTE